VWSLGWLTVSAAAPLLEVAWAYVNQWRLSRQQGHKAMLRSVCLSAQVSELGGPVR